jgi:hypothetical protein
MASFEHLPSGTTIDMSADFLTCLGTVNVSKPFMVLFGRGKFTRNVYEVNIDPSYLLPVSAETVRRHLSDTFD